MSEHAVAHLSDDVVAVTERLVALLDDYLPGQLEAFYLVGSVGQGDYLQGRSDVDFVAVLIEPVSLPALAQAHADVSAAFPNLDCDGIYLRPGELSAPPSGEGIAVRAGRINPFSAEERHPVVWLLLAEHGIALRGRDAGDSWIATDTAAAARYSGDNLQSYWRPWLEKRRHLDPGGGMSLLDDDEVCWGALGVARLYMTITTGAVPSKSAAGYLALEGFPEHARILREALRIRGEPAALPLYVSLAARQRDLIAFMDSVISKGGFASV